MDYTPPRTSLLRRAILSGHLVIATCRAINAHIEADIVEAARVTGRTRGLRIVHIDAPPADPGMMGPFSRRVAAEPERRRCTAAWDATLPRLTDAEASAEGAIIVLSGQYMESLALNAERCFVLAERTALVGKRPHPILISDLQPGRNEKPCQGRWPGTIFRQDGSTYYAWGAPRIMKGLKVEPERDDQWDAAVGEFDAHAPIEIHDGLVVAEDATRMVCAATIRKPEGTSAAGVHVIAFEIGPDGWFRGMGRKCDGEGDAVSGIMLDIVRTAWRGGMSLALSRSEIGSRIAASIRTFVTAPRGLDPFGSIRARIDRRIDARLLDALGHSDRQTQLGQSVLRHVGADPALRGRRRDFVLTWPAFHADLLSEPMASIVDGGGETLPAIAAALGTSRAVTRRVVGRKVLPGVFEPGQPGGRRFQAGELVRTGRYLTLVGYDNLPPAGDHAEWSAFLGCTKAVMSVATRSQVTDDCLDCVRDIVMSLPGRTWAARRASLARMHEADLPDIGDCVRSLGRWLQGDGFAADANEVAFQLMFRHGSLAAIAAASARWHSHPLLGLAEATTRRVAWSVPFQEVDLGDGWTAVALASSRALSDEGAPTADASGMAGLRHCVGGYFDSCASGKSLILSLRHTESGVTRRVSTVELVPDWAGDFAIGHLIFGLSQHRAARNAAPGDEATRRVERLRTMLAEGRVATDVTGFGKGATEDAEADDMEDLNVERRTHEAWRTVLPPSVAALDMHGLRDLANGLSAASRRAA